MALLRGIWAVISDPLIVMIFGGILYVLYNAGRVARFHANSIKVDWLRKAVQGAIDDGTNALGTIVRALQTEFVDEWKRANADGKLTDEEKAKLRELVIERLQKTIPESVLQILKDNLPDFGEWVQTVVDSQVQQLKIEKGEVGPTLSIPLVMAASESETFEG